MKKTLLSFLAIFLTSCLFANTKFETAPDSVKSTDHPTDHSSKHELSLSCGNPFSNLFSSSYLNYYSSNYYYLTDYPFLTASNFSAPTYDLTYKYHPSNRIAFRVGLNFNTTTSNFKQTSSSSSSSYPVYPMTTETNGLTQFGGNIGMEISRGEGKAQWFAGGALFYQHSNSKDNITDSGTLDNFTVGCNSLGISPLIGVRYYISKMISVSVESKLNIFRSTYTIEETSTDPNYNISTTNSFTGSGLTIKLSPIGQLGVNIHF